MHQIVRFGFYNVIETRCFLLYFIRTLLLNISNFLVFNRDYVLIKFYPPLTSYFFFPLLNFQLTFPGPLLISRNDRKLRYPPYLEVLHIIPPVSFSFLGDSLSFPCRFLPSTRFACHLRMTDLLSFSEFCYAVKRTNPFPANPLVTSRIVSLSGF